MRSPLTFILAALAIALPAAAQPAPDMKTYASSAEVAALIDKARAQVQANPSATLISQPIVLLAPYRANLEYRTGRGAAAVHQTEAELVYVIEGSGLLVMGGQMVNPHQADAHDLTGDSIEGGQPHALSKGDVLIVPRNTPHQVTDVDGALVLMTLHMPWQ